MKFKRFVHSKKQEKAARETARDVLSAELMPEEVYQMMEQACCSYSMLPLCGFPEGPWYFV